MPDPSATLTIGELSHRSGVAASAIRYYEDRGLISSQRTAGNQRLFARHTLRRLAVLTAGQRAGLTLAEIRDAFAGLPPDRAPTRAEWTALSSGWVAAVDARIRELEVLRDDLDGCIGCGCLSLTRCALLNPGDSAAAEGPGSRWVRAGLEARDPSVRPGPEARDPSVRPGLEARDPSVRPGLEAGAGLDPRLQSDGSTRAT